MGHFPKDFQVGFDSMDLGDMFKKLDNDLGMEQTEEHHQAIKDKVAEFVAARSLWRSLRPTEARKSVCASARKIVIELGGELPTKLALLLPA